MVFLSALLDQLEVLIFMMQFYHVKIYVKNFPTVLFLVKEIAKLERERFVFCPRLFREAGGP